MNTREDILNTPIVYLKGVGPRRAETLQKEMAIFTYSDLLHDYPFRYVDKSKVHRIAEIRSWDEQVQVKGNIISKKMEGGPRKKRLRAVIDDGSGQMDLVWFHGVSWITKQIQPGDKVLAYGRLNLYRGKKSIVHPELEKLSDMDQRIRGGLEPVYHSSEKMAAKGLDTKGIRKLTKHLFKQLRARDIRETLPEYLIKRLRLPTRYEALQWIHFPPDEKRLKLAEGRLKFEELFFAQLRLVNRNMYRKQSIPSYNFDQIGEHFNHFYKEELPFELTGAQKRVLKEIRRDLGSGHQMNRLLQGDVGSGKTIVALMSMLIAADNGYQSCLMAPTEILAQQHYQSLSEYLEHSRVNVVLLTGSVKGNTRKAALEGIRSGSIHILVGTHAVLEDPVVFDNLGLAITDEQHRFGVAQRARLWSKATPHPPHVLVMTATPIPRTLAMSFYGDLDVSVIDELPPGRKPVKTVHMRDGQRSTLIKFMKQQIAEGRQIYVVYPLIEESSKLDLQNLEDGYERLLNDFPRPTYQIAIVHGRMKAADKDAEMQRFAKGRAQILVATTVIEVGVNVPNASVMVIENAERFGLSQLHQLRGRVGRGAAQSFCVLMSGFKLSKVARERIGIMCETNDGFKIAEADLKLRGPGDIEGTRQSGDLNLKIANLATDGKILRSARNMAKVILKDDPNLEKSINRQLRYHIDHQKGNKHPWSKIS